MAQIQMRMPSAAPMTPTTAGISSTQQMKTPSSGMLAGMTAPTPLTVGSSKVTVTDHPATHGISPTHPTNGHIATGALVSPEGVVCPSSTQDTSNTNVANTKEKTPMCLINELARFNKIQHQYRLTDESGPAHKKTFTVLLKLGEEDYEAVGLSIKKAQHSAASTALEKTAYPHPPPKPKRHILKMNSDNLTPTVELNALAMKRGEPAIYSTLDARMNSYVPQNLNYRGSYLNRYHYPRMPRPCYVSLRVGSRAFIGEGLTLQSARHNAAEKALRILKELPLPEVNNADEEVQENGVHRLDEDDDLKSPISLVHEVALKRNLRVDFEVVRESGPPHMRNFVTKCVVGNLVTEGEGNGKKLSKRRSAEKMLDELKKLPPMSPTVLKVKKKPTTVKKKSRNLIKDQKANPDYGQGINPISRLIQIQQAKKEKEPVYSLVTESGLPCKREFVMQVQVGPNTCAGTGPNKKLAKRAAAEGLLHMLGYSRPQPQPSRPAMKLIGPENDGDKNRKVTFLDQDALLAGEKVDGEGRTGRQLVPGLLLMPDALLSENSGMLGYQQTILGPNVFPNQDTTIATIAKELLDQGKSPTAESILKSGQKFVSGQNVTPKQQLAYLADVLGFNVQFTDFPRGNKCEYLSLVSLSTNPPHVSHGAGETLDASHDQAALTALRALAELGLDNMGKVKKEPGIPSVDMLRNQPQNGSAKTGTTNLVDLKNNSP